MSTPPMQNAILAIWHVANKGKTETLREVARLLLQTFPQHHPIFPIPLVVPQTGDFRMVVSINGRVIAVESEGDPNTDLSGRLKDLVNKFGANVIFCSTRTKGDTVAAVDDLATAHGFEVIWTSTYQTATSHGLANHLKAEHIIELMRRLSFL